MQLEISPNNPNIIADELGNPILKIVAHLPEKEILVDAMNEKLKSVQRLRKRK